MVTAPSRFHWRHADSFAVALLALIYWLICHRYTGIWHDAYIYTLLAAHWLNPAAYGSDLFFIFGSQDSFSVYTPFFGYLIALVGIDAANYIVVLVGMVLWIIALVWLARGMLVETMPFCAAVLVCVVTTISCSPNFHTFTLNENYATARSIAIPLALMAIAANNSGWGLRALLLVLFATALHPLVGIWSLLILLAYRLSDRQLLGCAVSALVLFAIGAWAGLHPSLQVMDQQWVDIVRHSSRDVFLGGWGTLALNRILFCLAALWLGGRLGTTRFRRLYLITALLAAWAILLSQICSYWFPVHLVMEVQPWRVLWLAVVLGIVALADVGWKLLSEKPANRYWMLPTLLALSAYRELGGVILLVLVVLQACGLLSLGVNSFMSHRRLAVLISLILALAVLPTWLLMFKSDGISLAFPALDAYPAVKGIVLGGGGFTFLMWGWLAGRRWGQLSILVFGLPMLAYSLWDWDMRSKGSLNVGKAMAIGGIETHPFKRFIHPGDVVAKENDPLGTWFRLGTANYSSSEQAIGIVFSREKTIESRRRQRRMEIASEIRNDETEQDAWNRVQRELELKGIGPANINKLGHADFTAAGIHYLCTDPILDWVVSGRKLMEHGVFHAVAIDQSNGETIYLYDCRCLRAKKET